MRICGGARSQRAEVSENLGGNLCRVRGAGDLLEAKELDKTGIILGFQNTSPIEDDLGLLTIFHRLAGIQKIGV